MKAAGFYKTGGPEVLETVEVEDPVPSDNEITIRVSHTSLNNLDTLMRSGATRLDLKFPHITGTDIVGKVERVGKDVKEVATGEKVMASTIYGCGGCLECRSGNEVLCKDWRVPGLHVWGSYGELVKLPGFMAIRPPSGFSDEELGCMPLCLSISWRSLRVLADAKEGETVVIRGASGNVGIFSIMLAKAMKLSVIALTRSAQKERKLKEIGADHVLLYEGNESKSIAEVTGITEGRGADIVLDPLGSTLNDSVAMLRPGGRAVVFGTSAGLESNIVIKKFYWKSASVFGAHNANRKELAEALEFAAENGIKPLISRRMKVSDAAEAHALFAGSTVLGKISMEHRW